MLYNQISKHQLENLQAYKTGTRNFEKSDEMDKESHTKLLIERGIDPDKNLTPIQVIMMYKKGSSLPEKRHRKNSSDEPEIKVPRKKFEKLNIWRMDE